MYDLGVAYASGANRTVPLPQRKVNQPPIAGGEPIVGARQSWKSPLSSDQGADSSKC